MDDFWLVYLGFCVTPCFPPVFPEFIKLGPAVCPIYFSVNLHRGNLWRSCFKHIPSWQPLITGWIRPTRFTIWVPVQIPLQSECSSQTSCRELWVLRNHGLSHTFPCVFRSRKLGNKAVGVFLIRGNYCGAWIKVSDTSLGK